MASQTSPLHDFAPLKPHSKINSWSRLGSKIAGTFTTEAVPPEKTSSGRALGSTTKKSLDSRISRPAFTRGIGLTPRFFEAILNADPPAIKAQSSVYLPVISKHVESVAPRKSVFAQYWCPVVVEDESRTQHALHVDPLVVRKFRRGIAQDLQHVRDKRKHMLQRIQTIRQELPHSEARDISLRLQREIDDARAHLDETLLHPLPASCETLHVFIEVTPYMAQLELVCQYLVDELPSKLSASGVARVTFSALTAEAGSNAGTVLPASLGPLDWQDGEAWQTASEWLSALRPTSLPNKIKGKGSKGNTQGFNFAQALRWATTADALEDSETTVMLIACSKPLDLTACIGLARRSQVVLQMIGVFGLAPEDPEPALQELMDAAIPGSSLWLFFGRRYWAKFIAVREQQLQQAKQSMGEVVDMLNQSEDDIVDPKVFEMRLIERIMHECYCEEQQCEQELICATRVLERSLIDNEDITAVLRGNHFGTLVCPRTSMAPATAR